MIRSTKHTIRFANSGKQMKLNLFLAEYNRVGQLMIDYIWENGIDDFAPKHDKLNIFKYLDYKIFKFETLLSARELSSLTTQVSASLSSSTERRRKLLWLKDKLIKDGKPTDSLVKTLNKPANRCIKPTFTKNAELSSKCADIQKGKSFDLFLQLKSLGKSFGTIKIPLKLTARDNFWSKKGERLNSFLIGKNNVEIRYRIVSTNKTVGEIVGADQGMKTVITFSDTQVTPIHDIHGHSLSSICGKLSKKLKGSKAFRKTQDHRKNFINWSINQLNLDGIKEIRLEKIKNINFGKRASRKMQAWTNTNIVDKLQRYAEEHKVCVSMHDSTYKSQRCSKCGNVRTSNRKGEIYSCKNCGNTMNVDLNAAKNHAVILPPLPFGLSSQRLNLKSGFFWNPGEEIKTFDGVELRVPLLLK